MSMGRPNVRAVAVAVLLAVPAALPVGLAVHTLETFSTISAAPVYGIAPPQDLTFPVTDGVVLSYGLWRPRYTGNGTLVNNTPVIVTAGPYFALLDHREDERADRLGNFLVKNFVPQGFAVVQLSVRGTGRSGGCMELMSVREARDLHEFTTYLGTRPWTNASVGFIGKSYDGGAAWMAAPFGNPYLKTIVPIAGVTDQGDLLFHNGTSELRGPFFHSGVYYPFGFGWGGAGGPFDVNPDRWPTLAAGNANCPPAWNGTAFAATGYATGSTTDPVTASYWAERDLRPDVRANHTGSVFVVHGFYDWNVDPHQVIPFWTQLTVPKKIWLGQWGHHYPDRQGGSDPTPSYAYRSDFANTLLPWFNRWLKNNTSVNTGSPVLVQEHVGTWRNETDYPPSDASPTTIFLGPANDLVFAPPGPTALYPLVSTQAYEIGWDVGDPPLFGPFRCTSLPGSVRFSTAPLGSGFRWAGPVSFTANVRTVTGGNLYAELCKRDPFGNPWALTKAEMNLLYADGTRVPKAFTPGLVLPVAMQFMAQDVFIPAGWTLEINVYHDSSIEPLPNPGSTATVLLSGPGQMSALTFPQIWR
ncbi:MAG: CocE/NonD family hydrolase [Methanobacteriota archaeon]